MKIRIVALMISVLLLACENYDYSKPEDHKEDFAFKSLKAGTYEVNRGKTVPITAVAQGYKVKYEWTAFHGFIRGTGGKVTFYAFMEEPAEVEIYCTVTDNYGNLETKTVTIVVL